MIQRLSETFKSSLWRNILTLTTSFRCITILAWRRRFVSYLLIQELAQTLIGIFISLRLLPLASVIFLTPVSLSSCIMRSKMVGCRSFILWYKEILIGLSRRRKRGNRYWNSITGHLTKSCSSMWRFRLRPWQLSRQSVMHEHHWKICNCFKRSLIQTGLATMMMKCTSSWVHQSIAWGYFIVFLFWECGPDFMCAHKRMI